MSNEKHYPLHPNATHPPIMTCEIPLEEYDSIKRENAELKDKCQMHDFFWEGCGFAKRGFKNTIAVSEAFDKLEEENAELKAKLESVQATAYAESVDAGMENRRLKRALWLARANRAMEKIAWFKLWNASISTMNPEDVARQEYDNWKKNLGKFLAKAEEYK